MGARPQEIKRGTYLLLVMGLALLLYGCAPAYLGAPALGPLEVSDPQVAAGQILYDATCSQCHPGGGAGLGPGIAGRPLPDWAIKFQVRHGLGAMPPFSEQEIDDEELDAIIAYINALRERLLESEVELRGTEEER